MEFIKNINNTKVLTEEGYKTFYGISKQTKPCISINCGVYSLTASYDHMLKTEYGFERVNDILLGTGVETLSGLQKVISKHPCGDRVVYDIVNVDGTKAYYTNDMYSHNCVWIDSSDQTINEEMFEFLKSNTYEPKYVYDNGHYKIWEEPSDEKIYVASVDTSEGIGRDASVVQIFDYTDLTEIKQVACYHNNEIAPYNFVEKVHEILQNWGMPLVCVERNNSGAQVVDGLKNVHNYEKIVSWGASKAKRKSIQNGIISHTNTKHIGVTNMRHWVTNVRAVSIRDIHLINELKTFTKGKNGKWQAKSGFYDDRVAGLMWNLIILIDDVIEQYFTVVERDEANKPLLLEEHDYGIKEFMRPGGYMSNENEEHYDVMPALINNGMSQDDDMAMLEQQGWTQWGR